MINKTLQSRPDIYRLHDIAITRDIREQTCMVNFQPPDFLRIEPHPFDLIGIAVRFTLSND